MNFFIKTAIFHFVWLMHLDKEYIHIYINSINIHTQQSVTANHIISSQNYMNIELCIFKTNTRHINITIRSRRNYAYATLQSWDIKYETFLYSDCKNYPALVEIYQCRNQSFLILHGEKNLTNSKNTSHAFVAGFVLAILVKKSYILSRDPFMLKKYQVSCF